MQSVKKFHIVFVSLRDLLQKTEMFCCQYVSRYMDSFQSTLIIMFHPSACVFVFYVHVEHWVC